MKEMGIGKRGRARAPSSSSLRQQKRARSPPLGLRGGTGRAKLRLYVDVGQLGYTGRTGYCLGNTISSLRRRITYLALLAECDLDL